jgi:hypothetical protein
MPERGGIKAAEHKSGSDTVFTLAIGRRLRLQPLDRVQDPVPGLTAGGESGVLFLLKQPTSLEFNFMWSGRPIPAASPRASAGIHPHAK